MKRKSVRPKSLSPFSIEKKLVVQVRYYEHMYLVRDRNGDRVYTGTDEKTAKAVQAVLNANAVRERRKRR